MAVAGTNYDCLYPDVGTNGRVSDGGIWNKTLLLKKLGECSIRVPEDKPLPFGKEPVPDVLVGDDAFALQAEASYGNCKIPGVGKISQLNALHLQRK